MATFLVYFSQSGLPAPGLTPAWFSLHGADGQIHTPQAPPISEVGGGWYRFELTRGTPPWQAGQLVGVIDGGSSLSGAERYLPVILTEQALERQADLTLREPVAEHKAAPGSLAADMNLVRQALAGKRSQDIAAGAIRIYDDDGTTVLRTLQPDEQDGVLILEEV